MFRVSPLTASQTGQAALVERTCLETAWSEAQLRSLPPDSVYLVAEDETGAVCGICSARLLDGEAELLNLAVLPAFRRMHIASDLLSALFSFAIDRGCGRMYLEVAKTNESAVALYRAAGFREIGVRRGFYRGVDAWTMEKTLC
ncbi:MAG: GNAT family N-acetyltransferase [Clostridia bacterium]|nr:GNAT family N-acetyltransferase [Clostridia bacterium]